MSEVVGTSEPYCPFLSKPPTYAFPLTSVIISLSFVILIFFISWLFLSFCNFIRALFILSYSYLGLIGIILLSQKMVTFYSSFKKNNKKYNIIK